MWVEKVSDCGINAPLLVISDSLSLLTYHQVLHLFLPHALVSLHQQQTTNKNIFTILGIISLSSSLASASLSPATFKEIYHYLGFDTASNLGCGCRRAWFEKHNDDRQLNSLQNHHWKSLSASLSIFQASKESLSYPASLGPSNILHLLMIQSWCLTALLHTRKNMYT